MEAIDLLLIQFIVVFVIDISGVINSIKSLISRLMTHNVITTTNYSLKPFDCSLCMTFWCCIIYLITTNSFTLPLLTLSCFLSATTSLTLHLFNTFYDYFIKIVNIFN